MLRSSSAFAQTGVDGGLTAAETGWSLSANLLVNGDFSQGTTGWTFQNTCFSIDPTTTAPNGASSLLFNNPPTCSHTPIAMNEYTVNGGAVYTISGQIKTGWHDESSQDFESDQRQRHCGHNFCNAHYR